MSNSKESSLEEEKKEEKKSTEQTLLNDVVRLALAKNWTGAYMPLAMLLHEALKIAQIPNTLEEGYILMKNKVATHHMWVVVNNLTILDPGFESLKVQVPHLEDLIESEGRKPQVPEGYKRNDVETAEELEQFMCTVALIAQYKKDRTEFWSRDNALIANSVYKSIWSHLLLYRGEFLKATLEKFPVSQIVKPFAERLEQARREYYDEEQSVQLDP